MKNTYFENSTYKNKVISKIIHDAEITILNNDSEDEAKNKIVTKYYNSNCKISYYNIKKLYDMMNY